MAQDQVAGPPKPKEVEYDENGEIIGAPRTHQQIAAQKRMEMTKAQVDEVVDIMKTNYEKVLERDVKLSELDDRADALEYGASQFEQQAKSLKNKFWLQNLKMMLIMGAIGLVIIGLLYVRYSGSNPVAAVTGGGAAPAGGVAAAPAAGAGVAGAGVVAAPVDNAGGTPAPSHFQYSGLSPVAAVTGGGVPAGLVAPAPAARVSMAGAGVVAAPIDNAGGTPANGHCKYFPTVQYNGSSPVAARGGDGWRRAGWRGGGRACSRSKHGRCWRGSSAG